MLAGAAARGCRVFIISPSLANGPNPQPPVVAMQHDVMRRLVEINQRIGPMIRAAGGELRVGLYTARAEVTDLAGRRREIQEGLQRSPWIKSVIPFDSATLAILNQATTRTEADGEVGTQLAQDERPRAPQLHQKTQLIALPGAMNTLVRLPGWANALAQSINTQQQQTAKFTDQLTYRTPEVDTTAMRANDQLLTSFEQNQPESERKRVSFYFSVGTQNMDDRGLASDGEASVIVSGYHAAAGVVDLYNVMARSRWITTEAELDQYVPAPSGLMRRLVRWFRGTL
jgi:hypothetical protein